MSTTTNRTLRSRTSGRAGRLSIGIAAAAMGVTTFGAASASAATVTRAVGNSVSIGTVFPVPTNTSVAAQAGAYSPGGKGSPSQATCAGFNRKIQQAQKAVDEASSKGAVAYVGASVNFASQLADADNAGCVVIDGT